MQFEYRLVPASGRFPSQALAEMVTYLDGLATRRAADNYFVVYPDAATRELHPPPAPGEPDWVNGFVDLTPERVTLGVLPDEAIQRHLYEFAAWAVGRWPARLNYAGAEVPLSELLPDDSARQWPARGPRAVCLALFHRWRRWWSSRPKV